MRRHIFVLAGAIFVFAINADAGANYNDAGCGLGSMLFASNTKGQQILAGTTNGIASQTFAISSVSSDCREAGIVRIEREREVFAAVNFRALSRELAVGEGDYASSLASLMGCRQDAVVAFLTFAKSHYADIVPDAKTTPKELVRNLEREVSSDPVLSTVCVL